MSIRVCTKKIHRAIVTGADLNYVGSISICPKLLEASGIKEYQYVNITNLSNGTFWQTYVLSATKVAHPTGEGEPGKIPDYGAIVLNGPPARHFQKGDVIIILAEEYIDSAEVPKETHVVFVGENNQSISKEEQEREIKARTPDVLLVQAMKAKKIAIIEIDSESYPEDQAELRKELAKLGEIVLFNPQKGNCDLRPSDFDLIVNRLSPTSYNIPVATGSDAVFKRAFEWLNHAGKSERPSKKPLVVNDSAAFLMDISKVKQCQLLEFFGRNPASQYYETLEAIVDGSKRQLIADDCEVYLKLAAGGSGKGTRSYRSLGELKRIIKDYLEWKPLEEDKRHPVDKDVAGMEETEKLQIALQSNFKALGPKNLPPETLILQQAVAFDEQEPIYQKLLEEITKLGRTKDNSRWVLRVECFGYKVQYGARMAAEGYNFCYGTCPLDNKQIKVAEFAGRRAELDADIVKCSEQIAAAAGMELCGIEWMRDTSQRWWVIDINGLSIFRRERYDNEPEGLEPVAPYPLLARYLARLMA